MKKLIVLLLIITFSSSLFLKTTNAFNQPNSFVRTANYFLLSGTELEKPETIRALSQYNLIVIPLEAQVYNQNFFKTIRSLNKNIIILAYVPTVSWNDLYWTDPLHQAEYPDIQQDWWLHDANGKQVSVWPNTRALNLNSGWSDYLAHYVKDKVLSTGLWDGVFYDEVQDSISWVGAADVDKDGVNDTAVTADQLWAKKYTDLFSQTRSLIGDKAIMITNGSSNPAFAPYVNGRMFETFPSSTNTLAEWKNSTRDYLNEEKNVGYQNVDVVNVNSDNTGIKDNYQKVRFGITTTLLGNGYFGFDFGTQSHNQLWTYDEYPIALGAPKTTLKNIFDAAKTVIDQGVWQRDFEQGRVLVNATSNTVTVPLDGDFEKIHGTQDPAINDGSVVSEITLAAKDGIILLRPIDNITNTPFRNGAFARIFDATGKTKRTGFFAYDSKFKGGIQIEHIDWNHDGRLDTIVADQTYVRLFDADGNLHSTFAPYGETYKNGVNIAVAPLEPHGEYKIVTGTLHQKPLVKIFDLEGTPLTTGFYAYDKNFLGGVNVAIADLNGDGSKQIVTAAAAQGGAQIRIFNKSGKLVSGGFFAYPKTFTGGAYVATGDVDGDGKDEIVTGMGIGGAPEVRVFDKVGKLKNSFFASDKTKKAGIKIAVTDLDGDGTSEIIGLTTDVFTLSVFK
ncbi:MAG: putative glycoside hydrolase [Candidatus Uhrbacteria bacterium]|nr:putative glycoside hydrolase [Candidatus Uhrbacteria bacterium]